MIYERRVPIDKGEENYTRISDFEVYSKRNCVLVNFFVEIKNDDYELVYIKLNLAESEAKVISTTA